MDEQKKHAACDECRSRKLKCSGAAGGCDRCLKDRVDCHYSLQKPMGRPRKRLRDGDGDEDNYYYDLDEPVDATLGMNPGLGGGEIVPHSQAGPAGDICAQWEDGWGALCRTAETSGLLSDEFGFINSEFGHLRSLHDREQHMDEVRAYLASEDDDPPPVSATAASSSSKATEIYVQPPQQQQQGQQPPPGSSEEWTMPGCTLPTCSCALDLFAAIATLQTAKPAASAAHLQLVSRGALAAARASLACSSCLSAITSAYSSFMLLAIALPLLVIFYRRSLSSLAAADGATKYQALAAVRAEFTGLAEVVDTMDRLSRRRKNTYRLEGVSCGRLMADGTFQDVPLCRKILSTVKLVAVALSKEFDKM